MQTRKIVAAAAVAAVATIGLATAVSANVIDNAAVPTESVQLADKVSDASAMTNGGGKKWYWVKDDGSLVAVDDNNVGPFQACHNYVPVNGVGGQVPVSDIAGIVGWGNDGNTATIVKTCEQDSKQVNDGHKKAGYGDKWYRVDDDSGLVSVSNNNVGPFQACHNDVPVNGVGGQVPVKDISGILGFGNDGNSTDIMKTCEQSSKQIN